MSQTPFSNLEDLSHIELRNRLVDVVAGAMRSIINVWGAQSEDEKAVMPIVDEMRARQSRSAKPISAFVDVYAAVERAQDPRFVASVVPCLTGLRTMKKPGVAKSGKTAPAHVLGKQELQPVRGT